MDEIIYIIKIIAYFAIILFVFLVSKKYKNNNDKYPFIFMVITSTLFGFYSIMCGAYPYSSDRLNYAFRFQNDIYLNYVRSESLGLSIIERALHLFTHDPLYLFFTVSALSILILLFAYKKSPHSTPLSLIMIMLLGYPIYSFYLLKQILSIAFISLAYVYYERKERIKSILASILAIMFHESALIILPTYILMLIIRNKKIKVIIYAILAFATIFFKKISAFIIRLVIKIIPSLSSQLTIYVTDSGEMVNIGAGTLVALKGIPYYYIAFKAIKERKTLKETIKNYDYYVLITVITAITYILSAHMYWTFRFGLIFIMSICEFTSMIYYNSDRNRRDKLTLLAIIIIVPLILSLKDLVQYYFIYGGV